MVSTMIQLLCALAGAGETPPAPRLFLLDPDALAAARDAARAGDRRLAPALQRLRADANEALAAGPYSVTHKAATPPSGDRHDYRSVGPYWWPDPGKPDGLPYIRRDGEVNPERDKVGDSQRLRAMIDHVTTLATAWHYTADRRYADRAALLLRTWYLEPATRMNPNMTYAQAIPGRCEGRGIGIVDAARMIYVVEAVGLLHDAPGWSDGDADRLRAWFASLLDWLLTSDHGRDEARTRNNHATQYDAQVAAYALFVGRRDLARRVLGAVGERRIATQIEPDGRQPRELARTKSWDYSCHNLRNLCHLALLGRHVGVDLWAWRSDDKRSIRRALDWLLPWAAGRRKWTHKQISPFKPCLLMVPLRLAARRWDDPAYPAALADLPDSCNSSRDALLFPAAR